MHGFPQIFETLFLDKKIQVSHGFANVTFDENSVLIIAGNEKEIGLNKFIKVHNFTYKNLGVKLNKNTLILQRLSEKKELFFTNIGYNAIPFKSKRLNSSDSISLKYFGKLVANLV